jgi:hypothetical protein
MTLEEDIELSKQCIANESARHGLVGRPNPRRNWQEKEDAQKKRRREYLKEVHRTEPKSNGKY